MSVRYCDSNVTSLEPKPPTYFFPQYDSTSSSRFLLVVLLVRQLLGASENFILFSYLCFFASLSTIRNYKKGTKSEELPDSGTARQTLSEAPFVCTICEKSHFIVMWFFTDERTCFCLLCTARIYVNLFRLLALLVPFRVPFTSHASFFCTAPSQNVLCVLSRFIQQMLI